MSNSFKIEKIVKFHFYNLNFLFEIKNKFAML